MLRCLECEGSGGFESGSICIPCSGTGHHPKYRKGDATQPELSNRLGLIIHIVNTRGGWGRGFVRALSNCWPEPERAYREWYATGTNSTGRPFELGQIQSVAVTDNLAVVNMIAQAGYGKNNLQKHRSGEMDSTPPIRYEALEQCLIEVARLAKSIGAEVFAPKIGSGLAGGDWSRIEGMINRILTGVTVTIYEF